MGFVYSDDEAVVINVFGDEEHKRYEKEKNLLEETFYEQYHAFLDLCGEYYRKLNKEFNYLISDEAVIKTLQANEYYFTKNGEIISIPLEGIEDVNQPLFKEDLND